MFSTLWWFFCDFYAHFIHILLFLISVFLTNELKRGFFRACFQLYTHRTGFYFSLKFNYLTKQTKRTNFNFIQTQQMN